MHYKYHVPFSIPSTRFPLCLVLTSLSRSPEDRSFLRLLANARECYLRVISLSLACF